jgi:SAM-dependent methyltransferase
MDRAVYERMNELETRHWWFVSRRKVIAALIDKTVQDQTDFAILEAGCGSGGNLLTLARYGQVDAFEYDATARQHAVEKTRMDVRFGALPDEVPFDDRLYDLIGLFDVLEHVDADVASLATLRERLSDRGVILITVPAFPWLWSQHDERHHHMRRYTRSSLEEVAKKAGLKVRYASYFNFFLFPVAIAMRILKRLSGSNSPDDEMPRPFVNTILTSIFSFERHLIGRIRLPVGLSLAVVLEKAGG